jgi:hypothetical protein
LKETKEQDFKKDTSATFEDFWALYPKKIARGDAKRAWSKIGSYDKEAIIRILKNGYRFARDRQFIPYPATWLRAERWMDEQEPDDLELEQVKLAARIKADKAFWHSQEGARQSETLEALLSRGLSYDAIRRYFQ